MKTFLQISIVLMALGCGTKKNSSTDQTVENDNIKITASIGEINQTSDVASITDVKIKGNKMLIDITYSGGCEAHSFQLVGAAAISKSLPPIRSIQLIHNANGDQCKKLVSETIEADISALAYKQETGSTIILTLDGWKEKIEYVFE